MSAFAMFSLKSPSLLAFDKQRVEGHWGTIYGIGHVPGDTQMRERLDPVSPESLRPADIEQVHEAEKPYTLPSISRQPNRTQGRSDDGIGQRGTFGPFRGHG